MNAAQWTAFVVCWLVLAAAPVVGWVTTQALSERAARRRNAKAGERVAIAFLADVDRARRARVETANTHTVVGQTNDELEHERARRHAGRDGDYGAGATSESGATR